MTNRLWFHLNISQVLRYLYNKKHGLFRTIVASCDEIVKEFLQLKCVSALFQVSKDEEISLNREGKYRLSISEEIGVKWREKDFMDGEGL